MNLLPCFSTHLSRSFYPPFHSKPLDLQYCRSLVTASKRSAVALPDLGRLFCYGCSLGSFISVVTIWDSDWLAQGRNRLQLCPRFGHHPPTEQHNPIERGGMRIIWSFNSDIADWFPPSVFPPTSLLGLSISLQRKSFLLFF